MMARALVNDRRQRLARSAPGSKIYAATALVDEILNDVFIGTNSRL
jgi:hypothetical protein